MACFWAPDHKPELTLSVEFEWKSGIEAKDWTNVAKKGSVDVSFFQSGLFFSCLRNTFFWLICNSLSG